MERQDFWYHPEAKRIGAVPTGCKVSQFLFLSALTSIDLETGTLVRNPWDLPKEGFDSTTTGSVFLDAKIGPIKAQTWRIYKNLSKILSRQGSSLDNIIRQRIYLCDVSDTAAMEETMLSFFPNDKPATMILGISNKGVDNDIRVQVEVIAFKQKKDGLQKESVYVPELTAVTGPYPQAVKIGQFLFFSGMTAINPASGRVVTKIIDLGDDAISIQSGRRYTDATVESMKAQRWLIYKQIELVLHSQGATVKDIVHEVAFYTQGLRGLVDLQQVRVMTFPTAEEMPALSSFGVRRLSVDEDVTVVNNIIALVPGEYQKGFGLVDRPCGAYHHMWVKAGPLGFNSGEIPINFLDGQGRTILSFSDLSDDARFLAQGSYHSSQQIMAQAWFVYKSLDKIMRGGGSQLSKVVMQNIYMRDVSQYSAVERVAGILYNGKLPPTSVIPLDDVTFMENAMLEIELIALVT